MARCLIKLRPTVNPEARKFAVVITPALRELLISLITFYWPLQICGNFLYVIVNGGVLINLKLLDISSPRNSARPSSILRRQHLWQGLNWSNVLLSSRGEEACKIIALRLLYKAKTFIYFGNFVSHKTRRNC
ncbi:hypothetical protein A4A49_05463 [Nicotiana attenuata]|uniref:Uncharacterized protein n=1 Tax=Nicotiana attenuata TaxID=49451 RepID=A0A314L9B2_NICAT|nr:hypothetical protein A4A49_05463 [Nicotiana attenuata]